MLLNYDKRVRMLRQRLRAMTESGRESNEHRNELQIISQDIPNSIRVLDHELADNQYTCGMHALCLERSEDYAAIAGYGLGLVYAGTEFFEWIIANKHLNEVTSSVVGDLVMYFSQGRWTHIGRLTGPQRVESKWGVGLLCEHDLLEVPEQYGDEVRFFRNPGADASLDLFLRYAKARGIQLEE